MNRYDYNNKMIVLLIIRNLIKLAIRVGILIFILSALKVTVNAVVFRSISQPEVKVFGRVGLPIELPETEVVVTEEPVEATREVSEPVEKQEQVETPKPKEVSNKGTKVALTLSHYTDSAEENGGYAGLDAMGQKLKWGTLASNNFKKGTKIYIEQYEHVFTVSDVGSSKYLKKLSDGSIKVDVFVPRRDGESRTDYRQRVLNLGIIKTYGYIQ